MEQPEPHHRKINDPFTGHFAAPSKTRRPDQENL
jgi:hypothetical protein